MSQTARRHSRELQRRTLLYLPIVLVFVGQVVGEFWHAPKRIGLQAQPTEVNELEIKEITPGSPAARARLVPPDGETPDGETPDGKPDTGFRKGDLILQVNEDEILKRIDYASAALDFHNDEDVVFVIERDGKPLTFEVTPGLPPDVMKLLGNLLIVMSCLAMGLLTIAKRPGSLPAKLLYRLFALMAAEAALPAPLPSPAVVVATQMLRFLVIGAQFGTALHLVSLIPQRPAWLRRRPWIVPLYYSFAFFTATLAILIYFAQSLLNERAEFWDVAGRLFYAPGSIILAIGLVLILAHPTFTHSTPQGRRQAGLVLCGLFPWVLYITMLVARMEIGSGTWLSSFRNLSLLPFPVSIFVVLRLEETARNRLLRNLVHEVREAGSVGRISQLISANLQRAFHTKCNYVFFREHPEREFISMHRSGSGIHVEHIPSDHQILEILEQTEETLVYSDVAARLPPQERVWLDCLEARLLVPLVESDGHMAGILILGEKHSEEPYTPDDLALLRALARQIAMAYENIQLQFKVQERERIEREMLERFGDQEILLTKECPKCGFCFDSHEETCPRDGKKLLLNLPVERRINGRYRLEQVLGRGGVAVVYLASDQRLDRGVAIKVLALSLAEDPHAPRRFEREARLAAQLVHPNIVTTHDFGKTENGLPFIVMEHLEGRSLREIVKREGALPGERVAEWFEQILEGLAAAHETGVIHRDLKPDNVFILNGSDTGGRSRVKLLDFGLAKLLAHSPIHDHLTSPGAVMGTLAYMAPEQLEGSEVDQRADLYSVGVMVYEAVTGRRPFEGRGAAQLLTAILKGGFDFPDNVPEAQPLRRVLDTCFRMDPRERWSSAVELRQALIPALTACPPLGGARPGAELASMEKVSL